MNATTSHPADHLPPVMRSNFEDAVQAILTQEDALGKLHAAIDRLARHRTGALTSDELAVVAMPGIAAPPIATCITELLVEDVIQVWRAM